MVSFSSLVYANTDFRAVMARLPGQIAELPTGPLAQRPAPEADTKAANDSDGLEPLPLKPSREPLSTEGPRLIAAVAPLGSERISLIGAAAPLGTSQPSSEPRAGSALLLKSASTPFGEAASSLPTLASPSANAADSAQRTPLVGAPPWIKVASGPLADPPEEASQSRPQVRTPLARTKLAALGGPADALARTRIPLKDGGEVGADRLLNVQERVWYWKSGAVRRQLSTLISVLVDTSNLDQAIRRSGLSLNEVQHLLAQEK